MNTAYVLNDQKANALNSAILQSATTFSTLIEDWINFNGPIPSLYATRMQQLNYIPANVIAWGDQGLNPGQLRSSTNPLSLLPDRPLGSEPVVNDLMTYLAETSSVQDVQAAVLSFNNQPQDTLSNTSPAPPSPATGWTRANDDSGSIQIEPEIDIAEATPVIHNALIPQTGAFILLSVEQLHRISTGVQ